MNKYFEQKTTNTTKKRVVIAFLLICVMFTVCIVRLLILSQNNELKATAIGQSTVKLNLYNLRGNIFDCNLEKITNETNEYKTIFFPNKNGIKSAKKLLGEDSLDISRLLSGYPIISNVKSNNELGTVSLEVPKRYKNSQTAVHILGYINSENVGVSGIEKGMEKKLYSKENAYFSYVTDAKKKQLSGEEYKIERQDNLNGVILTIDKKFQAILEKALKKVNCGAGVIVEVETGKIKACASVPTFNINNLSESLKLDNAPFINRALTPYSTGSVFKTCVTAAGLEEGITNKIYYCKGYVTINKQRFNCHKKEGHGFVDLQKAIAESCNCYFYKYAKEVGAENIYNLAMLCGFGMSRNIGGGLSVEQGTLPSLENIKRSENALANFAIGQGNFAVSPLTMTNLYSAVCNNGSFIYPYIVEGEIKDGKVKYYKNDTAKTTVMSSSTARKIKQMLIKSLDGGTGRTAKPKKTLGGGKTATAQTGWIKNGRKIDNSWFCGFFEANGKTYVASILIEDIKTQKTSCTKIFREISDEIYSLY